MAMVNNLPKRRLMAVRMDYLTTLRTFLLKKMKCVAFSSIFKVNLLTLRIEFNDYRNSSQ